MAAMRRGHVALSLTASVLMMLSLASLPRWTLIAQNAAAQRPPDLAGLTDSLALIANLLDRGRGIEAENVARALLARVEDVKGRDAIEVAQVLDLLGRAVRRSPRVADEEKRELAERAVVIKERVLGPWHPDVATSLTNLAIQRVLAGDPASARPVLERALAIRERAYGADDLSVAATLQSLAGVLMTMKDDAGAQTMIERALRIREAKTAGTSVEMIQTLFKAGLFATEINDYTSARTRYERALSLAEASLGQGHPLFLAVLQNLAIVMSEGAGDSAAAAQLDERLVSQVEKAYGLTNPRLTRPLENLAIDRRDLGEYAAAKTAAERSVAIAERAFGPKHPELAGCLHVLATVLAAQGDRGAALETFEHATRINEDALHPVNAELSRATWVIPDLLTAAGYNSDDVILFEQAVALRERTRGLADSTTGDTLTSLAGVLSSMDDFTRTRPLFERALTSREQTFGPDHPEVAAAATNLAYVLLQLGDRDGARPLYERALTIWEKRLGSDHPKVASALVNLATVLKRDGDHRTAAALFERAAAIQQKSLGPDHPDLVNTFTNLAELAARAGSTHEAVELAAHADAIRREHVRLTSRTLSERQALAYAASGTSATNLMLSLAADRPRDQETVTAAWNAVVRGRAIVLDEMAERHRVASATEDEDLLTLVNALAAARQRLAAAVVRGVERDSPERYRRLLDQARSDKDRAEQDLAQRSAQFRAAQSEQRVSLADVTAALPSHAALVSFVEYRRQNFTSSASNIELDRDSELSYLAFVIRGEGKPPDVVPLQSARFIDELIVRWRHQLDDEALDPGRGGTRVENAYRRVAGGLRQRIWDPLLSDLSNATEVFIVPDGALHLVSFAAFPAGPSRYMVETGPLIHYLSTERDLMRAATFVSTGAGLLALGGPAFDASGGTSTTTKSVFRGTRSACEGFQLMQFDPLPAALKEVESVVAVWNRASHGTSAALRLTGPEATESAFKEHAPGHRVIHVATHGFFLGASCASALDPLPESTTSRIAAKTMRENPLLLSGLIFAGANRRQAAPRDQEDGVLTAEEVAAMNLNGVDWAVLSGCDTGIGAIRVGEGVFGLRRAFQVAGVRTVIMSLWSVDDKATRSWMTALYEGRQLNNMSTAHAVRSASLAVLQQRRAAGLSTHPFYWAAFVATGDWH